jgi:hypothetical protein
MQGSYCVRIVQCDWHRKLELIARANETLGRWRTSTEKINAILTNSPLQECDERLVASGLSQGGQRSDCDDSLNARRRDKRSRWWWHWFCILLIHLIVASEHLFPALDRLALGLARFTSSVEPGGDGTGCSRWG